MTTKVYLASRYRRIEEMQEWRSKLEALGIVVTSRWINGDHQAAEGSAEAHFMERQLFAMEDMADLLEADIVVSFTEEPRAAPSRGGRHVEFGAALALGKLCIVVGPCENVFHCMPEVQRYDADQWEAVFRLIVA